MAENQTNVFKSNVKAEASATISHLKVTLYEENEEKQQKGPPIQERAKLAQFWSCIKPKRHP